MYKITVERRVIIFNGRFYYYSFLVDRLRTEKRASLQEQWAKIMKIVCFFSMSVVYSSRIIIIIILRVCVRVLQCYSYGRMVGVFRVSRRRRLRVKRICPPQRFHHMSYSPAPVSAAARRPALVCVCVNALVTRPCH